MKFKTPASLLLSVLAFASATSASAKTADELAVEAVSSDSTTSSAAIRELREMGPAGFDVLFAKYGSEIEAYGKTGDATDDWKRIAKALDAVAMQYDSYAAHLYWYTDLEAAKRAAKAQHKPILSLRLLGNLNEEFSCANSRLFRAILYPNEQISKYLHDNYILHWKSVRPAPRITIDFGDGRKIERTITGNSIHYILSEDGDVIDAIPGLYSPSEFMAYLTGADSMNTQLRNVPFAQRATAMMKFRKDNFDRIIAARDAAVAKAGVMLTEPKAGTIAINAAPMAMAKAVVVDEYRILRVYDDFAKYEPEIKFDDWVKLAKIYAPELKIDQNSVRFVRRQNGKTGLSEAEFATLFKKIDDFVALDTTRNDYLFHTKIYQWLNEGKGTMPLEDLNAAVYDQIFQTPNYDKWLGLYSPDVYTALDGNGIVK
ncbi:MAG TPA: hypothetical protein VGI80_05695 [Pyrinomonadaceae bacterium]|jgi:hypothetical protein